MPNDYTILSRWVRKETLPHAEMLTRLRERLTASLERRIVKDRWGVDEELPAEIEPSGAPTRNWCRGYVAYKDGFKVLLEEQRHRDQMVLMARNKSSTPMSEEEYAEGMASMMAEAVAMLSVEDLQAELARRGIGEPARFEEKP